MIFNRIKTLGSLLLILVACTSWGQEEGTPLVYDTIYLKDGSFLEGYVARQASGDRLEVISVRDNHYEILKVDKEKVDRIVLQFRDRENFDRILHNSLFSGKKTERASYNFQERGIYNATYGSVAGGRSFGQLKLGPSLHNVTGFQFNRWIGVGLGLGVDVYSFGEEDILFPVFVEARGYFFKKNSSPYYSMNAGYGFELINWEENNDFVTTESQGGYLLHPAIGWRLGASDNANFLFDVGYRFQKKRTTISYEWGEHYTVSRVFKRFMVRAGVIF